MSRQTRSLVAAVVTLSLLGGSGTAAMAQDQIDAAAAAVGLPASIPASIPSGKLKTPFGPARWVHLKGDSETLPDFIDPLPAPGGHVVLEEGGGDFGPCPEGDACQSYARLWFTPDLLEWSQRTLPTLADYGRLTLADGQYWLIAQDAHGDYEPPSIWRSADALEWQPIDLTGLTPPEPDLVEWQAEFDEVASSGDTVVVPVSFQAVGLRELLGLEEARYDDPLGWVSLVELGAGDYVARGGNGEKLGRLRFGETDTGLTVIDGRTGAELAALEGVDMDFIEQWAQPKDPGDTSGWSSVPAGRGIAVIDGDGVTMVDTPETSPGMRTGLTLGTGDGFTLFSVQGDGTMQTWRSTDGLSWEEGDLIGDEPGEPVGVDWIHTWENGLVAGGGQGGIWRSWESTDGTTWKRRAEPGTDGAFPRFGPGYVDIDAQGISFREDGERKSKRVKAKPLRLRGDRRGTVGFGVSVISPTTLSYSVEEESKKGLRRDHWIMTFDRLPAAD